MRLATAADIRRIDERAETEFGMPRLLLMENAGLSVVLAMERVLGPLDGKRVTVFCGKGGNGGDGLCAARHLVAHGAEIVVGLAGSRDELAGETRVNWAILDRMGLTPTELKADSDLAWARAAAGAADYVVDALVGVGARLPLTGLTARLVEIINESGRIVVAVDVPSGLAPDTGGLPGPCVLAGLTITLGLPKRGQVLYPGTLCNGKLVVADLTVPPVLLTDPAITADILLPEEAAALLPRRGPTAHKHEVGRALVIAGSRTYSGAALLAGAAALTGGAGLVTVAAPAPVAAALAGRRPELLLRPQPETPSGGLAEAAADDLLPLAATMHGVAVGPGLGLEESTQRLVLKLLEHCPVPLVVDADALTALAARPAVLARAKGPRVLTPHEGEAGRLLGIPAEAVGADRLGAARRIAEQYGAIAVLKGARTVVAEPGGRVVVVPTGNAGLATAGTGDVLTGLLAALLAQRLTPLAASLLGAYAHGLAGDLARDGRTDLGMTATDVIDAIPAAYAKLKGGGDRGEPQTGGTRRSLTPP